MDKQQKEQGKAQSRRKVLRGLIGLPFIGGIAAGAYAEVRKKQQEKDRILNELNIEAGRAEIAADMSGEPIRVGIVGNGGRGQHLVRVLGFAAPAWIESVRAGGNAAALQAYQEQENLNVRLAGVCDVFDVNAELAQSASPDCKRFRDYESMINSPDIDAVVIATPDHWHAPVAIAALEAGKHVYVEKPMTHNIEESYALREAARSSKAVFQVGHQHRQTQSFITAQDIIRKKVLGHVSLVQANTNRNSDNGAWQYPIHGKASPQTIDWDQFLGNAPRVPFNKEHFFRWRKWWAYGSGLSGDLMTHDYDRVNCILEMGMPRFVTASGGIYTHHDGRDVPDVFQAVMEYPDFSTGSSREAGLEKGMTFMYSATLGNQYWRETLLMGHDGTLELGNQLRVYADPGSTRYKNLIESGVMDPDVPIYTYDPASGNADGVTSATAKYFAQKGLLWTYSGGKRVDSAMLHLREWLSGIRNDTPVSCGINEGFEEAMSAHMAGLSWKLGRRMEWDAAKEQIIALPGEDLDEILLTSDRRTLTRQG
jgi:predicted dehydrogenase